ncbi:MAG TPA: hypothetical protein VK504_11520 [Vicinamibacterales bacterium]|nr:hypothetical protein [Vicinamibacterales bacterium]
MSDLVHAPFTPHQVRALNAWQQLGHVQPFTCDNDGCRADLVATVRGWICPFDDYTQDWAHSFMADAALHPPDPMSYFRTRGGAGPKILCSTPRQHGSEPDVIYATVRVTDADDIDIEYRFSDGQKFAAVRLAVEFDRIGNRIAQFLILPSSERSLVDTIADQNREIEQLARGVSITKDADIFALRRDLLEARLLLDTANEFTVAILQPNEPLPFRDGRPSNGEWEVFVAARDGFNGRLWMVGAAPRGTRAHPAVLSVTGDEWEPMEPQPSDRSDDWLAQHRFVDRDTAIAAARKAAGLL